MWGWDAHTRWLLCGGEDNSTYTPKSHLAWGHEVDTRQEWSCKVDTRWGWSCKVGIVTQGGCKVGKVTQNMSHLVKFFTPWYFNNVSAHEFPRIFYVANISRMTTSLYKMTQVASNVLTFEQHSNAVSLTGSVHGKCQRNTNSRRSHKTDWEFLFIEVEVRTVGETIAENKKVSNNKLTIMFSSNFPLFVITCRLNRKAVTQYVRYSWKKTFRNWHRLNVTKDLTSCKRQKLQFHFSNGRKKMS